MLVEESAGAGAGYRGKRKVPPPHAASKSTDATAAEGGAPRPGRRFVSPIARSDFRAAFQPDAPPADAPPLPPFKPGMRQVGNPRLAMSEVADALNFVSPKFLIG
ncbi:hypothetical protein EON62_04670 [archaeon]|nr:MAG: hypothetical protein EON62_04670 [archaeon]